LYCKQCSVHRRLSSVLANRTDMAARFQFLNQKELFKTQCRDYQNARLKWLAQQVEAKLATKGLSLNTLSIDTLALITGTKTVMTGQELIEDEKRDAVIEKMKASGEFDRIAGALKGNSTHNSIKDQFLAQAEDDEIVRDFSDEYADELVEIKPVKAVKTNSRFNFGGSEDPTLGDFDPI